MGILSSLYCFRKIQTQMTGRMKKMLAKWNPKNRARWSQTGPIDFWR